MIIATELGDKTFFIAAILSMKTSRLPVFLGAVSALVVMTVLSALMGVAMPMLMDRKYTHLISGVLFLYFGCKLLYDARSMEGGKVSDELAEVEEELVFNKDKKDDRDNGGDGGDKHVRERSIAEERGGKADDLARILSLSPKRRNVGFLLSLLLLNLGAL